MVPKFLKEVYSAKLKSMNKIQVIGVSWFVFYNSCGGYISNLGGMLECFRVNEKETTIFTMDDNNYICARIYQKDGKEIDYVSCMNSVAPRICRNWVWSVVWNESGYSNYL